MTTVRTLSAAELASLVAVLREAFGWTQETLAELSGLTVRTIQRVEAGEGSNLHSRRALARAFGYEDMDHFSRLHEVPTPEEIAAKQEAFDRDYIVIDAEMLDGQSLLLRMKEGATYRAFCPSELSRVMPGAREAFAAVADFVAECLDVLDDVPKSQVLDWGKAVDDLAAPLAEKGLGLLVGERAIRVDASARGAQSLPCTVTYVTLAAKAGCARRKLAVLRNPAG